MKSLPQWRRTALLSLAALALAGCATPNAPARPSLTFVGWSGDVGNPLRENAVLVATLKFNLAGQNPSSFRVFEQYDTPDPLTTLSVNRNEQLPPTPTRAEGETTVTLRLADALQKPGLSRPLRVKFVLMQLDNDKEKSGLLVATTGSYVLKTEPAPR